MIGSRKPGGPAPTTSTCRHLVLTFMDDLGGVAMGHEPGVNYIMWSTDFPNPVTSWPDREEPVARNFDGVPEVAVCLLATLATTDEVVAAWHTPVN